MLESFCRINEISMSEIQDTTTAFTDMENLIDRHNEEFITKAMVREKEYLDNILKAVDPAVSLDDDQRRVVLTDEDYCLVIAGAGAGKTTTVAAKVKYLVDKQGIKPSQILVVSFTNKYSPEGLINFRDFLRNQSIHTMPVRNPAAIAVENLLPAGMEHPVMIISKEFPGIPGVTQLLILRIVK